VRSAGRFPVFVASARGAHFTSADGSDYVDFCLGDTGAMAGHTPPATTRVRATRRAAARAPHARPRPGGGLTPPPRPTRAFPALPPPRDAKAVAEQAARGATFMLPTADAVWVGRELRRRFGLPYWQFALTATDANRFSIRLARHLSGRPKILVFNYCYHGSVDEVFITLKCAGEGGLRQGALRQAGPWGAKMRLPGARGKRHPLRPAAGCLPWARHRPHAPACTPLTTRPLLAPAGAPHREDGRTAPRAGNIGPPVDPALTTRVVEWNDAAALEAALAAGDVAAVLAEPVMTNIGIIHPLPGFHTRLRELTRRWAARRARSPWPVLACHSPAALHLSSSPPPPPPRGAQGGHAAHH
jgi:glutamate-1-semialdehyde aminotransferase